MREKSSEKPPRGALMWPSSEVPAPNGMMGARWVRGDAHDLAHFLGILHPDHRVGRLVGDPGDGVGVLAADRLAGLQPVAEALPQHGDGRCHVGGGLLLASSMGVSIPRIAALWNRRRYASGRREYPGENDVSHSCREVKTRPVAVQRI